MHDLVLMSLLIFLPTAFALVLCIPGLFKGPIARQLLGGEDEAIRWWTLLGTLATLLVSIVIFIDYYGMIRRAPPSPNSDSVHSPSNLLPERARLYERTGHFSDDWLARIPWIRNFNIHYYLGIDGISMPLILLTTVVTFLAMIASWPPKNETDGEHHHAHWAEKHVRGYCILFLLLETGMLGTFLALDFFLFYIFWEVMLLPMYFLIGIWGGPRREYAAIKFFLYTLLGSIFILIALLGFYFTDVQDFASTQEKAGPKEVVNSFDLLTLSRAGKAASAYLNGHQTAEDVVKNYGKNPGVVPLGAADRIRDQWFFNSPVFQVTMFLLLFVGFAIKVPVFPFHTWLPDAHVEAPTPISMILAGVLLKMGGYGILRIAYPICPYAAEALAFWLALLGIINIVYGAFAAMAQTDFKKLVAYSSISHMGYVILGIAVWSAYPRSEYWSWGMNGAMYQMIAHGITSAGMFFLVGVIYDRAHHRNLDNFRGLAEPMPLYTGISAVIFFAAMGLPGMCGFIGEFMVVLSTWNFSPAEAPAAGKVFAVLAALTVVLTAGYILWTVQRVFLGTNPAYKGYPDVSVREVICIVPLVILSVLLGVLPMLLLKWMEPSVKGLVDSLAGRGG